MFSDIAFETEVGGLGIRFGTDSIHLQGFDLETLEETDFIGLGTANPIQYQSDDGVTAVAYGDVLMGFDSNSSLVFNKMIFSSVQISAVAEGTNFGFDANGDGASDQELTLKGNFQDEIFLVTSENGNTKIEIADENTTRLTPSGERFITVDAGPNWIFGDDGADVIGTAAGADMLSGGGGSDVMFGGDGDDTLIGGAAADEMTGGAGADIFSASISDFAGGGVIVDFITDFEVGVDQIELSGFGIAGLEDISFLALDAGAAINLGNNSFIVLEGIDSADLLEQDIVGLNQGRQMSLISTTNLHVLTDANDRFVTTDPGANEVFAGAGLDAIIGGDGNDILRGEGDDDVIFGGGGDDRLIGGQGSDELTGRASADSFEFTAGEETGFAVEFVTDYEAADTLVFNGFGYSSVDDVSFQNVPTGDLAIALSATRFVVTEDITDQAELTGEFVFG